MAAARLAIMIREEPSLELQEATRALICGLQRFVGRTFDQNMLNDMSQLIAHHRQYYRCMGIDYPVLVPLWLARIGFIEWVRADLDPASLKVKIVNFVRAHPQVAVAEVVTMVVRAFPSFGRATAEWQVEYMKAALIKDALRRNKQQPSVT